MPGLDCSKSLRTTPKRINHQETYSLDGACTNQAEEYFPAFAALKSAFIITLPGRTCRPMRAKWLGAKTTVASATASNT
jgi:hypothetical protein